MAADIGSQTGVVPSIITPLNLATSYPEMAITHCLSFELMDLSLDVLASQSLLTIVVADFCPWTTVVFFHSRTGNTDKSTCLEACPGR